MEGGLGGVDEREEVEGAGCWGWVVGDMGAWFTVVLGPCQLVVFLLELGLYTGLGCCGLESNNSSEFSEELGDVGG